MTTLLQGLHSLPELVCIGLFIYKWLLIIHILLTWLNPDPSMPVVKFLRRCAMPAWQLGLWIAPDRFVRYALYFGVLGVLFLQAWIPAFLESTLLLLSAPEIKSAFSPFAVQLVGHTAQAFLLILNSLVWFVIILLALYFVLTLVRAGNSPITYMIYSMSVPILQPVRRLLPPSTKFDYSAPLSAVVLVLFSSFGLMPLSAYFSLLSLPVQICVL